MSHMSQTQDTGQSAFDMLHTYKLFAVCLHLALSATSRGQSAASVTELPGSAEGTIGPRYSSIALSDTMSE